MFFSTMINVVMHELRDFFSISTREWAWYKDKLQYPYSIDNNNWWLLFQWWMRLMMKISRQLILVEHATLKNMHINMFCNLKYCIVPYIYIHITIYPSKYEKLTYIIHTLCSDSMYRPKGQWIKYIHQLHIILCMTVWIKYM